MRSAASASRSADAASVVRRARSVGQSQRVQHQLRRLIPGIVGTVPEMYPRTFEAPGAALDQLPHGRSRNLPRGAGGRRARVK